MGNRTLRRSATKRILLLASVVLTPAAPGCDSQDCDPLIQRTAVVLRDIDRLCSGQVDLDEAVLQDCIGKVRDAVAELKNAERSCAESAPEQLARIHAVALNLEEMLPSYEAMLAERRRQLGKTGTAQAEELVQPEVAEANQAEALPDPDPGSAADSPSQDAKPKHGRDRAIAHAVWCAEIYAFQAVERRGLSDPSYRDDLAHSSREQTGLQQEYLRAALTTFGIDEDEARRATSRDHLHSLELGMKPPELELMKKRRLGPEDLCPWKTEQEAIATAYFASQEGQRRVRQ